MDESKIAIQKFPSIIEIQLHNQCNANCIICPYEGMHYVRDKMTDNNFIRFVEEVKRNEDKVKRIIPYLNNEPFMEKDYISKLKILRANCPAVEIEISTNGSYLNEYKIKELATLEITELRISVFGFTRKTYDRMMPGTNYNKVFKNLGLIAKHLQNTNTLVSLIMIDNGEIDEEEFQGMGELAQAYGFQFCRWGFLDRSKNVSQFSNDFFSEHVVGCEQSRPKERMHVLANGDAIFCCQDWSHKTKMGNIFDQSLEEVWNSLKYNTYRKRLYAYDKIAPNICRNCKLAVCDKRVG